MKTFKEYLEENVSQIPEIIEEMKTVPNKEAYLLGMIAGLGAAVKFQTDFLLEEIRKLKE